MTVPVAAAGETDAVSTTVCPGPAGLGKADRLIEVLADPTPFTDCTTVVERLPS